MAETLFYFGLFMIFGPALMSILFHVTGFIISIPKVFMEGYRKSDNESK